MEGNATRDSRLWLKGLGRGAWGHSDESVFCYLSVSAAPTTNLVQSPRTPQIFLPFHVFFYFRARAEVVRGGTVGTFLRTQSTNNPCCNRRRIHRLSTLRPTILDEKSEAASCTAEPQARASCLGASHIAMAMTASQAEHLVRGSRIFSAVWSTFESAPSGVSKLNA